MSSIKSVSDKNLLFGAACDDFIERMNQAAKEMGHEEVFFCHDQEANLIKTISSIAPNTCLIILLKSPLCKAYKRLFDLLTLSKWRTEND